MQEVDLAGSQRARRPLQDPDLDATGDIEMGVEREDGRAECIDRVVVLCRCCDGAAIEGY